MSGQRKNEPIAVGIANNDLQAQLDNEIDLRKGDRVIIFGVHDHYYYHGECNGRQGIIPKGFVNLDESQLLSVAQTALKLPPSPRPLTHRHEPATGSDDAPPSYETALSCQSLSELAQYENLSDQNKQPSSSPVPPPIPSHIAGIESYARTLHTFQGEFADDLSFKPNEIVHLIRHIDDNWLEGELNGRIGIFPKSFVKIIVDVHGHQEPHPETESEEAEEIIEFPADTYARVIYDFQGELESDLPCKQNALITLLKKVGEEWLIAMDDNGRIGEIPVTYVEMVGQPENTYENSNSESLNLTAMSSFSRTTSVTDEPLQLTDELISMNSPEAGPNTSNLSAISADFDPLAASSARTSLDNQQQNASSSSQNSQANFSLQNIVPSRTSNETRPAPPRPANMSSSPRKSTEKDEPLKKTTQSPTAGTSTQSSTQQPAQSESAEARRASKQLEQRSCVIMELLQSERDYLRDLKVCYAQFEKPLMSWPVLRQLIGNLDEVIIANEALLKRLEACDKSRNKNDIGQAFIVSIEQMKQAYLQYCRNNDEVPAFYNKLINTEPDIKRVLDTALRKLQEQTNCFDIPSLLIKPVQRILKYPLLLSELAKCEPDARQQAQLSLAIEVITEMAADINEFKRRKDLVFKYRKQEPDSSLSARLSKLNMHTFRKKGTRFGAKLSSTLGLTTATHDEKFEDICIRFRTLEKTLKIFMKDLNVFIECKSTFLKQSLQFIDAIVEFYGNKADQQEVEELKRVHEKLITEVWEDLRRQIDLHVVQVLTMLLVKFEAPTHLIQKRADKLLDYDAASKRANSERDAIKAKGAKDDLAITRNTYEALNNQLIEELPKLTDYAQQIFLNTIAALLRIKKLFIGKAAKQALVLLELPLLLSSSYIGAIDVTDIRQTFFVKHNLIVNELMQNFSIIKFGKLGHDSSSSSHLERNTSFRSSTSSDTGYVKRFIGKQSKTTAVAPQTTNAKEAIQSKFQSSEIFAATADYNALDVLDLTIKKGDWVGIIKRQDPMGNTQRWFVDNGTQQGFVPCKYLSQAMVNEARQEAALASWSASASPTPPAAIYAVPAKKQAPRPPSAPSPQPQAAAPMINLTTPESEKAQQNHSYSKVVDEFDPFSSNSDLDLTNPFRDEVDEEEPPEQIYEAIDEPEDEFYVAQYAFNGGNDANNQFLPMKFGQVLLVRRKCDLTGNTEWWLVQDRDGKQGYVPANRLVRYTKPQPK